MAVFTKNESGDYEAVINGENYNIVPCGNTYFVNTVKELEGGITDTTMVAAYNNLELAIKAARTHSQNRNK